MARGWGVLSLSGLIMIGKDTVVKLATKVVPCSLLESTYLLQDQKMKRTAHRTS